MKPDITSLIDEATAYDKKQMIMDRVKEILDDLNSIDEHIKIEAKQCTNKVDKSVLETICAFSNEPGLGGGEILLGISDNPEKEFRYSIQGVSDADKIQKDLASQCATLFNHPIRPLISTISIKGKTVILITVKELDSQLKPLYFKNEKLPQGAWRRIGSTEQRCSDEDIRALHVHSKSDDFDKLMLEETDLNDIDENAVAHYRRLRAEVNPEAEELALSNTDMLCALKAVKKDKNGIWHLTTTGLLVFGKQLSLRREMPAVRVDYIRVPGNKWVPDAHNRFASIDMRGPLLLMVSRAYNAIADDLPRGFSLTPGQLQAHRPLTIPEDALREAIVNALIHQNFNIHRPIQIIRYNNRIEIINPGCSLKPDETLGEPGSEMRNPNIGAIFHDTNLAEAKGTGIETMRRLMKDADLLAPTFGSDYSQHTFTIRLLLVHLLGKEEVEWLSLPVFKGLNTSQKSSLIFLREIGAVDNITYRQLNGCTSRQASIDLKKLESNGLICSKGHGRNTYYVPTMLVIEASNVVTPNSNVVTPNSKVVTPNSKVVTPNSKVVTPNSKVVTPNSKVVTPNSKVVTPNSNGATLDINDIPEELKTALCRIGRKCALTVLENVIVELCKIMPLNIEQLSELTHRSIKYLRNKIIPRLLKEKRIRFTIPEMINHPEQKYQA